MSVRVKSSTTNPATSCRIQKPESSVAMNLDKVEVIEDNLSKFRHEHCEKVLGSNEPGSSPVHSVKQYSPTISQTPSLFPARFSSKPTNSTSGLVTSKTVKHHPFVPSFNRSVGNRRLRRAAKRATPKRVNPVLGMKRKNVSNMYISCYPKWKKRASCYWKEKTQIVGDCDQTSLCSSVSSIGTSWVENSLHASHVASTSTAGKKLAAIGRRKG